MMISMANAWVLMLKGGIFMWPIFFLSILVIALGIKKFLFLVSVRKNMQKLKPVFFKAVRDNRMKDALLACEKNPEGWGCIGKAGLMAFGASADSIRLAMEQRAGFEIRRIKRGLSLLSFIPNAAVFMGLLATSSALCVVFHAVQIRSNALNPMSLGDMSCGVWQALVTTTAGLSVGIIGFAIYSFIASFVNDLILDIEQTIHEAVELLQGTGHHES